MANSERVRFPVRGVKVTNSRAQNPSGGSAIRTSQQLAEYLARQGDETDSGAIVTADRAMRTAAVFSCVRVLSEDIAALPLGVYRKTPNGREEASDHWLATLLEQPNAWQTGFEFREMLQAHTELAGNFLALKTVVRGEVRELLPITPNRWRWQLDNWKVRYWLDVGDGSKEVPAANVLHVRGMTLDGVGGVSPITYQKEVVGLSIQQRKYGAKQFKQGAMPGGVIEHPDVLSPEAAKNLRESFDDWYAGVDNAHKTVLLEEGAKYNKVGMTGEEAQWLESMKFTRSEIAGIYRVPAHLINDLERATFSNIEESGRNYAIFGLTPRTVRIEKRLALSLLSDSERTTMYVRHNLDGLQRGNYLQRWQGYQIGVATGTLSRNEVREMEDRSRGPAQLDEFLDPAYLTGKQPNNGGANG